MIIDDYERLHRSRGGVEDTGLQLHATTVAGAAGMEEDSRQSGQTLQIEESVVMSPVKNVSIAPEDSLCVSSYVDAHSMSRSAMRAREPPSDCPEREMHSSLTPSNQARWKSGALRQNHAEKREGLSQDGCPIEALSPRRQIRHIDGIEAQSQGLSRDGCHQSESMNHQSHRS